MHCPTGASAANDERETLRVDFRLTIGGRRRADSGQRFVGIRSRLASHGCRGLSGTLTVLGTLSSRGQRREAVTQDETLPAQRPVPTCRFPNRANGMLPDASMPPLAPRLIDIQTRKGNIRPMVNPDPLSPDWSEMSLVSWRFY